MILHEEHLSSTYSRKATSSLDSVVRNGIGSSPQLIFEAPFTKFWITSMSTVFENVNNERLVLTA